MKYSSSIESTQLLCSHFPSMQKGRLEEVLFTRTLVKGMFFAIRTKVSMGDLVVEILLFSVAPFMLLPSFYVCT